LTALTGASTDAPLYTTGGKPGNQQLRRRKSRNPGENSRTGAGQEQEK
jgi:hypothetical protein